jgi:hypothetical protein
MQLCGKQRDMRSGAAAALLVVAVLAGAGAGYLVGTANPRTVTQSTTTTATTTDFRPLGIFLGLLGNSSVSFGRNETVIVSLTNELPYANNATYTGFPTLQNMPSFSSAGDNYVLPVPPSSCGSAPSGYIPYFVAIYNQSGMPLQLNDVAPSLTSCIAGLGTNNGHVFGASQVVNEAISLGGYLHSSDASEPWINATYHQFSPGTYTVVAFDPWNQLAIMTFTVNA